MPQSNLPKFTIMNQQHHRMESEDHASGDPGVATLTQPAPPKLDRLPPWAVLLHDDEVNDMGYVVETIRELTVLTELEAVQGMLEAHTEGSAALLQTHREHAELLQEQFTSKGLTVTIERAR